MRNSLLAVLLLFCSLSVFAQADRSDVRAGNRKYRHRQYKEAEIDYRKALDKDSTSLTARYDLASSLYRQEDYEGAARTLSGSPTPLVPAKYYYNAGNTAAKLKDWRQAVNMYKMALLMDPSDMDAKENYVYARKMLGDIPDMEQPSPYPYPYPYPDQEPPQDQDQDQDEDQDQDQDQNQDQDQDQNQDQQNQDQNQDQQNQNQDQQGQGRQNQEERRNGPSDQMSPKQMQQMLQAIRDQEKNTQDKVNREKAAMQEKSRHKEKNW